MLTQQRTWVGWARLYLHAFRLMVVTVCVGLAIYGWFEHIGWLFAAGTVIGTGELLECTYYLTVLDWGRRTHRLRSTPNRSGS
ncbi:MAG TPA: hypothetical protein VGJ60_00160 [Chloroflexota bacterium]|jgi:uncharacterized membrane protein YgdD (TMEM256/DUF423 family)